MLYLLVITISKTQDSRFMTNEYTINIMLNSNGNPAELGIYLFRGSPGGRTPTHQKILPLPNPPF